MSSIQRWGLMCAWSLLVATRAWSADPTVPASAGDHSGTSSARPVKPIPDCPHCRKLGLLGTPATTAPGAKPAAGPGGVPLIALPRLEQIKDEGRASAAPS